MSSVCQSVRVALCPKAGTDRRASWGRIVGGEFNPIRVGTYTRQGSSRGDPGPSADRPRRGGTGLEQPGNRATKATGGTTVSEYFQDYVAVAAFAAFGVLLVALTLGITYLVRPSNPTREKVSTYECGVDAVGEGWNQTFVRYYIFGLLFVVFDVEAVFIFPWAVVSEDLGLPGVIAIVVFILTLLEGLLYAVRKGVLRWE